MGVNGNLRALEINLSPQEKSWKFVSEKVYAPWFLV